MKPTLLTAVLLAMLPDIAPAATCGPREGIMAQLADRYGEAPRAMGLDQSGALMELITSVSTGTWTITLTSPDGTTCMILAGESLELVRAAAPAPAGRPM